MPVTIANKSTPKGLPLSSLFDYMQIAIKDTWLYINDSDMKCYKIKKYQEWQVTLVPMRGGSKLTITLQEFMGCYSRVPNTKIGRSLYL